MLGLLYTSYITDIGTNITHEINAPGLTPSLTAFFVVVVVVVVVVLLLLLRFAFCIIRGRATKNGEGLGTPIT